MVIPAVAGVVILCGEAAEGLLSCVLFRTPEQQILPRGAREDAYYFVTFFLPAIARRGPFFVRAFVCVR